MKPDIHDAFIAAGSLLVAGGLASLEWQLGVLFLGGLLLYLGWPRSGR